MSGSVDADLVRDEGTFPTEAQRWHQLDRVTTTGVYVTECGARIDDPTDRSPPGEHPTNLSGETVCYDCANGPNAEVDR